MPGQLAGGQNLGFMFLPNYRRGHRLLARDLSHHWYVIERTRLGSYLRAATENPTLVQAFGINVPRMITLTTASASVWRRWPACWRRRSTR